jgi:hypothetical protein
MSPVLEIMLYPMRDGTHWGATVKWSDGGAERCLRIMGGKSREELLGAVGAAFDRRADGRLDAP